jgi:Tfp pilus assembly protein PilF
VLKRLLYLMIVSLLLACTLTAQDSPAAPATQPTASDLIKQALEAFRGGKLDAAAEEFQAALKQDPKSAEAFSGLARTYLSQDKVQLALETANQGLAAAPDFLPGHSVLGEVFFRQARMTDAEREFLKGVNAPHPDARAYLGLSRIYDVFSLHARAKTMMDKAHEWDPNDPEILRSWGFTLKRSERIPALERYLAATGDSDPHSRESLQKYVSMLKELEKKPDLRCRLASKLSSTETELKPLLIDVNHLHGFGLNVKVNGQSSRLLLDTGGSGILINKKLGQKAGIKPLMTIKIGGIGDAGDVGGYIGYADSINIGQLEFRNCLVEVSDKRSIVNDDGLIGADVFSHYLVTIDFLWQKLRLQELPKRPGDKDEATTLDTEDEDTGAEKDDSVASGPRDRYIAPEMQGYAKILRFGHDLLIPTWVGTDTAPKLFLIDTGAMENHISLSAARAVTGVHHDAFSEVRGISGEVKKVYSADKAVLQFSHFKQENQDLLTIDMSSISKDTGTEVSGILGFTTLRLFTIKIDYRDGLVDFTYNGEPKR